MVAATLRFTPPRPEDEADLFNAGEAGHERIEDQALRPLVGSADRVRAVYFGNWQRDMSQVIAPIFAQHLGAGARPLYELLFDVVDVLAEAKFGRRLRPERFGAYRWEEHIDNPRDFGIALDPRTRQPIPPAARREEDAPEAGNFGLGMWREGPGGIPNFIHASRRYVLGQLGDALRLGPTGDGLEHFGNAMHAVEDMYAHSNFIELGLIALGRNEHPQTGHLLGSTAPLRDSLGRYRLTTGIFLLDDTLVSVQKLLLHRLEGPRPGAPPSTLGENVTRVLIRRLLGESVLATYDWVMRQWRETRVAQLVERFERTVQEQITGPLQRRVADMLRPLSAAAARRTGQGDFPWPYGGRIVEISHARLAKDDTHHRHHGVARELAIRAVADFWREIEAGWNGRAPRFRELIERYMGHPQAVGDWWKPIVGGVTAPGAPAPVAPAVPTPNVPSRPAGPPLLRRGARGHAVRDLQRRLNAWLGRSGRPRLRVDGIFGQRTEGAVRLYQRANGLTADGVVGSRTWASLLGGASREWEWEADAMFARPRRNDGAVRQRFMRQMLRKILAQNSHPLGFLVNRAEKRWQARMPWSARAQHFPAVQAGHRDSDWAKRAGLAGLSGGLFIEDAGQNQTVGQTVETKGAVSRHGRGVSIGGVPVEIETARMWARLGMLDPSVLAGASRSEGWVPEAV